MSSIRTDNHIPNVSDLTLVVVWIVVTLAVVFLDGPAVVRVPLGIVSVLVLPGYSLVAALFPAGPTKLAAGEPVVKGIDLLERGVVSIGASLALVVLMGIGLNYLLGGVPTERMLAGVSTMTLVSVGIASLRRRKVPVDDRYAPSIGVSTLPPRPDALVILLAVSILFAGGAVAYTELDTNESASLTELYFVTNSDTEREDYTTTFPQGTAEPVSLAVGNSEGEETSYTVVGQLQQTSQENGTVVVEERAELAREELVIAAGETQRYNMTIEPDVPNGDYRLVFLLYKNGPPQEPQMSNAYREVHLWVEIT